MGKEKLWNRIQLITPTLKGWIFVSRDVPPVTKENFEFFMEKGTKHVGGRHNRSCKTAPYILDDLFKLVSQQMINEGAWGRVTNKVREEPNEIEHLVEDDDESEYQPSENY